MSKTWILPESAGADLMKMCGKSSLSAACAAYGMELVSSSNSGGSVCRVCGGRVNYAERYARPGYCGCEGE